MSTGKEPAYIKNPISKEDLTKLLKIFKTLEEDQQAYDFLEPVNYVELGLLDYPSIISHPMDLGTVKKNLTDGKYPSFKEFLADVDLIWSNCRTYNMAGSGICKMATHCEKSFKKQMEKSFKNYNNKTTASKEAEPQNINANNESELTMNQKVNLTDRIRNLSNEGIAKVVNLIKKDCPRGIEDIDSEKLQIKLDLLDLSTYTNLMNLIENSLKKNSAPIENKDVHVNEETVKEEA